MDSHRNLGYHVGEAARTLARLTRHIRRDRRGKVIQSMRWESAIAQSDIHSITRFGSLRCNYLPVQPVLHGFWLLSALKCWAWTG